MPGAKAVPLKKVTISYGETADSDEMKAGGAYRDYVYFLCTPRNVAALRRFALYHVKRTHPTPKPSVQTEDVRGARWWDRRQVRSLLRRQNLLSRRRAD